MSSLLAFVEHLDLSLLSSSALRPCVYVLRPICSRVAGASACPVSLETLLLRLLRLVRLAVVDGALLPLRLAVDLLVGVGHDVYILVLLEPGPLLLPHARDLLVLAPSWLGTPTVLERITATLP